MHLLRAILLTSPLRRVSWIGSLIAEPRIGWAVIYKRGLLRPKGTLVEVGFMGSDGSQLRHAALPTPVLVMALPIGSPDENPPQGDPTSAPITLGL